MREIKFRAWDGEKMTNSPIFTINKALLADAIGKQIYVDINTIISKFKEDLIIMQYTGLKDKNGIEIYEGDIVRCIPFDEYKDSTIMYGDLTVYWNDKQACFHYIDFIPMDWGGIESYEIIGNIYEDGNNF